MAVTPNYNEAVRWLSILRSSSLAHSAVVAYGYEGWTTAEDGLVTPNRVRDRMIIGIDIDGVIADSEPLYRQTINKLFNLRLKQKDITSYQYEESAGLTDDQMSLFWKTFYREGGWLKIKPIEGAKNFLDKLKRGKHRIVIVTSRPREHIKKETYQWLEKHKVPYSALIFLENHKSKHQAALLRGHKFDYFIEDYYEYARDFAQRGVKVLLMDYPWNRWGKPHPNIRRIKNLKEAEAIISKERTIK